MNPTRTMLCWAYGTIAVVALVTTYSQYLPFPDGFLAGFFALMRVNHVARGLGIDLSFLMLGAAFFMVSEARRLNMRFVWLYLFFGFMIDISVAFPVFMIMRERAMTRAGQQAASLTMTDLLAAAAMTAACAWQVWFMLQ